MTHQSSEPLAIEPDPVPVSCVAFPIFVPAVSGATGVLKGRAVARVTAGEVRTREVILVEARAPAGRPRPVTLDTIRTATDRSTIVRMQPPSLLCAISQVRRPHTCGPHWPRAARYTDAR